MKFVWTDTAGVLRTIAFDTSDEETVDSTATVTEHPIEGGAKVVDFMVQGQTRLALRATVSNTPITTPESHFRSAKAGVSAVTLKDIGRRRLQKGAQNGEAAQWANEQEKLAANVFQIQGDFDRVADVYAELLNLQSTAQPFSVQTSLRTWDDCVLETLSAPRDNTSGNAVEFAMQCVQILFATSQTVAAPTPSQPRGRPTQARGAQAAEALTPGSETAAQAETARTTLQNIGSYFAPQIFG